MSGIRNQGSEKYKLFKRLLFCFLISGSWLLITPAHAKLKPPTIPLWTLMLTTENTDTLPRRFRTTTDTAQGELKAPHIADVNMSGSGQFSSLQFKAILTHLGQYDIQPNQVVVVDLREEPHAFINGIPVTWYAKGAWWIQGDPVTVIQRNEEQRLSSLSVGESISLKRVASKDNTGNIAEVVDKIYKITSLQTEEQVVKAEGAHYIRLPVTDHMKPNDATVDQFLQFIKTLPKDAWLHFHCHGGRGRSSTFMAMYAIMKHPEMSLDAIMDELVRLGSVDLRRSSSPLKAYKHPLEKRRYHFLKLFYKYTHCPDGYQVTPWTKWAGRQQTPDNTTP